MKRAPVLLALVAATALAPPAWGQASEKKVKELTVDFSVPESPAFTVLGLTPQSVTRPASPREFATSLLNGVDQNGNFQTGVALDTAPYLLLFGDKVTLQLYRQRRIVRFLSRTQFSFATTKGANEDDKSARMALGLHFTIFDRGDPRTDQEFAQCLVDSASEAEGEYKKELGLGTGAPLYSPALSADQNEARAAELRDRVERKSKSCRETRRKKNWNRSSWIIAAAPSWTSPSGSAGDLEWSGAGVWTSIAYGFENIPGLEDKAQLIFHARYRNKEQVPDTNATGQFIIQNSSLFGGRFRAGTENTSVSFEGVFMSTRRPGAMKDDFGRISLGVERKILENVWFVLALGGETKRKDGNNKIFVLTSFNWGFSRK